MPPRPAPGPRRNAAVPALLAALLVAACGAGSSPRITVGDDELRVEVVDTPAARARGLSGRDGLPPDTGMLFLFPEPGHPAFWMKDMRFDIDIVWIRDGRIVDVSERVPHAVEPPLPVHRPRFPADRVLEVPAGEVARRGWRVGDPVELHLPGAE